MLIWSYAFPQPLAARVCMVSVGEVVVVGVEIQNLEKIHSLENVP